MRSSESGKALYCCMFTPSMSNKTACVFCPTSLCRLKTKMKKKATAVSVYIYIYIYYFPSFFCFIINQTKLTIAFGHLFM
jgi:hypothetical protein